MHRRALPWVYHCGWVARGRIYMETAAYLKVTGSEQGDIRGGSIRRGREGLIELVDFRHQVAIPQTNKEIPRLSAVVHEPLEIVKEIDCSTPKLYRAMVRRESLETIAIEWYRYSPLGQEELYFSITLFNARIVSIDSFMPEGQGYAEHVRFIEKVRLSYERILWSWGDQGTIEFETDWHGQMSQAAP
jgi:type VI secretion system secreted protein Hcp